MRESAFILAMLIAFYLLISLLSFNPMDPGPSNSIDPVTISNMGGVAGAWLADFLLSLMGYLAYILPLMIAYIGYLVYRTPGNDPTTPLELVAHFSGAVLTIVAGTGLAHLHSQPPLGSMPSTDLGGGGLGQIVAAPLVGSVGLLGATLFLLALLLIGLTLFTGISWFKVMDGIGAAAINLFEWCLDKFAELRDWLAGRRAKAEREEVRKADSVRTKGKAKPRIEPEIKDDAPSARVIKEKQQALFKDLPAGELPPLEILDEPMPASKGYNKQTLEALSRQVELKLADFGIEVDVVAVHPGPVITRFELQPAPGIKGSQISNLAKDVARGLSVTSVRVVDVIPGKSVIGLEIPNANRQVVYLSLSQ
jgi:S-DNA-T family DNA segregation ATPase FtsK/SpoIIIE